MGLEETQRLLARLFTETALRQEFCADPEGVGATLGLDTEEACRLAPLTAPIRDFAASLRHKRLLVVARLLPQTRQLLGPRFEALFLRYALAGTPQGVEKHREDAIAFASFLLRSLPGESALPWWWRDLLRYEQSWLQAEGRRLWTVRSFSVRVPALARLLARSESLPETRAQPTLVLWYRRPRAGTLRLAVFSLPLLPRRLRDLRSGSAPLR
ncbi:MAG TPA: hypothetical protein VFB21_20385 [Chthonomonadaceae bacterium]|nr:hypothetical protein [Chthonomonadaceae bacterium]